MWPGCSISDSSQGAILPAALTPQCASLSPDLSQPPAEQCTAVDGGQTGDGLMCPGTSPPPPPRASPWSAIYVRLFTPIWWGMFFNLAFLFY